MDAEAGAPDAPNPDIGPEELEDQQKQVIKMLYDAVTDHFLKFLKNYRLENPGAGLVEKDDIDELIDRVDEVCADVESVGLDDAETAFAEQAAILNVVFQQFTRAAGNKHDVFDSMRIALRAQAQSRATYRSLIDLKTRRTPRPDATAGTSGERPARRKAPAGVSRNSSEQTNDHEKNEPDQTVASS
jgi:hypothetical protein